MLYTINLDMVQGTERNARNRCCVLRSIRDELKSRCITGDVVKEIGPAGGNSLIRLLGSFHALTNYVHQIYVPNDPESAIDLLSSMKEHTPKPHTKASK